MFLYIGLCAVSRKKTEETSISFKVSIWIISEKKAYAEL